MSFAGWQTAGLNLDKKTRPRPDDATAGNGHGAAAKHFRVLVSSRGWQAAGLNLHRPRLATGMGAAAERGCQTAGLNLHKKTMPRLATGMELQRSGAGVLATFAGWQTAGLNRQSFAFWHAGEAKISIA